MGCLRPLRRVGSCSFFPCCGMDSPTRPLGVILPPGRDRIASLEALIRATKYLRAAGYGSPAEKRGKGVGNSGRNGQDVGGPGWT